MGPLVGACIVAGGAVIFLFAGLWLVGSALRDFLMERASKHWPAIQGEIVSAAIREGISTKQGRTERYYLPKIEYAYAVNGKRYTANRIDFGGEGAALPSREEADVVTHKYPVGARVQVYYNPSHPATAVMEPAQVRNVLPTMLIGVAFFGGGIFLSLFAFALATMQRN